MASEAQADRRDDIYASQQIGGFSSRIYPPASDWRESDGYSVLLRCDRRAFAWEWLRRNRLYRGLWAVRESLPVDAPKSMGLVAWVDPALAFPRARPIWSRRMDPKVLKGHLVTRKAASTDLFDIRACAPFLSVEIGGDRTEHWLFSDGHWAIRLDVHGGTLLRGPALIEYKLNGVESAKAKLNVLRQFLALSEQGRLPTALTPPERRAARWILELRVGDAILFGVSGQEIARELFTDAIVPKRWRRDNASHRLRVQRLVRIARHRLADPFSGPWFQ